MTRLTVLVIAVLVVSVIANLMQWQTMNELNEDISRCTRNYIDLDWELALLEYEHDTKPTLYLEGIGLPRQGTDTVLSIYEKELNDSGGWNSSHYGVTIDWLNENGYALISLKE